jgi:hypothetical protein
VCCACGRWIGLRRSLRRCSTRAGKEQARKREGRAGAAAGKALEAPARREVWRMLAQAATLLQMRRCQAGRYPPARAPSCFTTASQECEQEYIVNRLQKQVEKLASDKTSLQKASGGSLGWAAGPVVVRPRRAYALCGREAQHCTRAPCVTRRRRRTWRGRCVTARVASAQRLLRAHSFLCARQQRLCSPVAHPFHS